MKLSIFSRNYAWHKWFAWHPVRTENDGVVWLETVERRASQGGFACDSGFYRYIYVRIRK
jgi:hypothetical protein